MIKEARGDSYVVLFSFAFFEQLGSEFLSFFRSLAAVAVLYLVFFSFVLSLTLTLPFPAAAAAPLL